MAVRTEAGTAPMDMSPERGASTHVDAATVDLGVIADRVLRSFTGQVPRERVERVLTAMLEQEFSGARVTTFLPLFLHRVACESLRRETGDRG